MLRMMTNRIYDEILRIKSNILSTNFSINEQNSRFVQLNSLRKLEVKYQIICDQFLFRLEQRYAYVQFSWWLSIVIQIEDDEKKNEKVIEIHDHILNDSNNITIYIDDSDINNTIEIATVWTIEINDEKLTRISVYNKATLIDAMHEYTIYFEKLYGILMTLELVKTNEYLNDDESIHIFVDNQTALFVCHRSKHNSSQYILKKIMKLHREFRARHNITLHWVFAHIDVPSNELTDVMTKKTTKWRKKSENDTVSRFLEFHILISASMFRVKRWTEKKWINEWTKNRHERTFYKLCECFTKRNLDKFKDLKRSQASVLVQFRIEKISLINYQYKIEKANSKRCNCDEVKNVQHVLLQCFKWTELRNEIYETKFEIDIKKLLDDSTLAKLITAFVIKSDLLSQFRNCTVKLSKFQNTKFSTSRQTLIEFSEVIDFDSTFSKYDS